MKKAVLKRTISSSLLIVLILCFSTQLHWAVQSGTRRVKVPARFVDGRTKEVNLEYRVTLNQDTFLLYTNVGAGVWAINLSKKTIWFLNPMFEGWRVKDSSGKVSLPKIAADQIATKVAPRDSIGGGVGLGICGVGGVNRDSTVPFPYFYLPVGKYSVSYVIPYTNPPYNRDTIGPFDFCVVEPAGEEAEALRHYLDAYVPINVARLRQTSTSEERAALYREVARRMIRLADQFPKSVYTLPALGEAMASSSSEVVYQINERILRDYPESYDFGFLYLYYGLYKDGKNNTASFRAKLDSIIKYSNNPKLIQQAREAQKRLRGKKK